MFVAACSARSTLTKLCDDGRRGTRTHLSASERRLSMSSMYVLVRESPRAAGTELRFASKPCAGDKAAMDQWRPVLTRASRSLRTVRTGYAYRPPAYRTYLRHRAAGAPRYVRRTLTSLGRAVRTAYRVWCTTGGATLTTPRARRRS